MVLTVEAGFAIPGRGVALTPHRPVPRTGRFQAFEAPVRVAPPSGADWVTPTQFRRAHFNVARSVDLDARWGVVILSPEASPEQAPPGAELFGSADTVARLNCARLNSAR